MDNSNISWTKATWNPWQGCDKVGPECENCYIGRVLQKQRRRAWGRLYKSAEATWKSPLQLQKRAVAENTRIKVFTCSLSDFFHRKADEWRPRAWEIIRQCPDLDFQILTKRAHRIASCLPPDWGAGYPNVWLGVSIGMIKTAHRADKLRKIPAVVRFVSAEPLLGSLAGLNLDDIHWLIAGGESGPNSRQMKREWAEELREKCEDLGVSYFFKQGENIHSEQDEKLLGALHHNWPVQISAQPLFGGVVAAAAAKPEQKAAA